MVTHGRTKLWSGGLAWSLGDGGQGVLERAWEGTCVPGAWSHGGGLSGTSWGVPWPVAGMLGCFTQAATRRGLPVAVGLG